ncbi:MAG: nickel pincer cofactor biosynthesis protein LarC [Oscillospiraceae bacterium]|nr:nickel pincer cofactor biosynthesis protein LarC [Oscillospiraceae bacterium]
MKTLFIDCGMGAAGDMLGAALLELMPDRDAVLSELNALGIPGVSFDAVQTNKCGITGTQLLVRIDGRTEEDAEGTRQPDARADRGLRDVEQLLSGLRLPEKSREDALAVYRLLAEAESRVHGVPVPDIHFHEIGTLDSVADIAAVCRMMELLSPDEVLASPVHVGSGEVRCAHGVLPVPAPATAEILKGVPVYGGALRGELCTPTGAALLKHFVDGFGEMPALRVQAIGYGMGKKDFERANCVRALLGERDGAQDRVLTLSCNLDDMSAEDLGFAMERLLSSGALDVFTVPIGMKKNRPGTMLCALCRPEDREEMVRLFFRHTTTLGLRVEETSRCVLDRTVERRQTRFGELTVKKASGYGVSREKYEYEDLARTAREKDLSIREVREELERERTWE